MPTMKQLLFSSILVLTCSNAEAEFVPVKILTGGSFSCALSGEGKLKCWGSNSNLQLATGNSYSYGFYPNSMGFHLPFAKLGQDLKVADVCLGSSFACVASTEGKVKCWGQSYQGAIGQGYNLGPLDKVDDLLPYVNLGEGFEAKNLSCSDMHVCALNGEGQAKCWGYNYYGELGLGDTTNRGDASGQMGDRLPILAAPKPIRTMSIGFAHSCGVFDDGIRCVGRSDQGVLGQEHERAVPQMTDAPPILFEAPGVEIHIRKMTTSPRHNCALYSKSNKDHVKCWGYNEGGILGIGSTKSYGNAVGSMGAGLPEVDIGFDKIDDIQGHNEFTCALGDHGKVKCWGNNQQGQLGIGDMMDRGAMRQHMGKNLPEVDLGLPVKALSMGTSSRHSCALLINNQVKCWGSGYAGQLGYEDGESRGNIPFQMGEFLPFVNIR